MKKFILFLAIVLFSVGNILNAQSTLVVADGTATNSYLPAYGLYMDENQHNQFIYPASMLGPLPNATISKLTFHATSATSSWGTATCIVKIGVPTETNFASATYNTTTLTQVYSGPIAVANNILEFVLSTPYVFSGGNLLIDITTVSGSYSSLLFNGVTATNGSVYQYGSNSITLQQFLPKMSVEFTGGTPMVETNLATSVFATSAIFSGNFFAMTPVTAGFQYMDASLTDWTGATVVNETTLTSPMTETVTTLSPNTQYKYRAFANDGTSFYYGVEKTFTTLALPAYLPYACDFENPTENAEWAFINGTQTNQWVIGNASYNPAVNNTVGGENALHISNDAGLSWAYTLATSSTPSRVYAYRDFTIDPGVTEIKLNLDWIANGNGYGDFLRVYWVPASTIITPGVVPPGGLDVSAALGTFFNNTNNNIHLQQVSTWQQNEFIINSTQFPTLGGNTWRLLIHWRNESTSAAVQPPATVDNISLIAVTCASPTQLVASNPTINSIDLTWTENGSATTWNVEYKKSTETTWMTVVANSNPFTVTGLDPSSIYNFRVQSDCSAELSLFTNTTSFATACAAITTLPWIEGFEGITANNQLPPCWSATSLGSYTFTQIANYGSYNRNARTGSKAAYFKYGCNDRFYTVGIELTAGISYDFSYWYVTDGLSGWNTLQSAVYSAQTTDSLIQIIHTLNGPTNNTYQRSFGSFTPTVDGVYYFGVYCQATGGPWYLTLDDFKVDVSPSCLGPVNASAQNITPTTADVVFSAGDPTTYNYTIYWKEASATTWNQDDIFGDTTYALINLTPNTVYNVKIAAECSDLTFSEATEFNFRTACSPFDVLPFTENFDSYTAGSTFFPPCWNRLSTYSTQPYVTTTNYSAPNSLYAPVSSGYYAYLIAPEPDPTIIINQLQVKFYAKGAAGESIQVGIMENISNSASFVPIQTIPVTASWAEYTAYLTNYSGSGNRIAFKMAPSVYVSYYIDNVEISSAPTCLPVNDLTVSYISGSSAYATWTPNGTPDYFTVAVSVTGSGTWNTYTTTNPNYILTGLTQQTPYTVQVSPNCSGFEGQSDSVNFITTCNVGGDVIVGTPAATTSTNGSYFPTQTYYKYSYTQQIFDAAEVNADSIFGVGFQYFFGTPVPRNITIYLGHTSQSTFTSTSNYIPLDSMIQVFQGSVPFTNVADQNWVNINFPAAFDYNGTSNLVVAVRDMTGTYTNSGEKFRTHSVTGTKGIYFYQDSGPIDPVAPSASSNNTSTYRSNIKFILPCLPATCVQPNIILTNVDTYSADMIIIPGGSETSWEGEYKKMTESTWTSLGTVSTTNFNLPLLSSNTTYQVRFRTVCGASDISAWKMISFTTDCGPILQVPFVENFDTYGQGSNVFPTCWVRHTTAGAYPYITTTPYNGPYSLYFYSSSTTYSMIVLPPLDPSLMLNTLQLTLFGRTGTAGNNLKVGVMTDPSDPSTFSLIGTLTPNSLNTYEELFISFANYTDTGRYIAIKSDNIALNLSNYMYIDSLKLDLLPSCVKPINIEISTITTTSATASWDASPTAVSYEVVYGLPGIDPAIETPIPVADTFFVMTPLTATTLYHFYVRSVCSGGVYSDWTNLRTFSTVALAPVPYTEAFATTTLPVGYNMSSWYIGSPTNIPGNPPNNIYINLYSYTNTGNFSTINIGPLLPNYQLAFEYKLAQYTGGGVVPAGSGNFIVAISTDWGDTYTNVDTVDNNGIAGYQTYSFDLSAYDTQIIKIKITGNRISEDYYLAVDNIYVGPAITCPYPNALVASNPTTTSIDLTWIENGTALEWVVEYGPVGFTQGLGTFLSATTNPSLTIPLLTPSTSYDFYVRSICGVGDTSMWSTKIVGTTLCLPTTLPFTEDFVSTSFPICWSQTYSGALTSNRWSVGSDNEAGGTGNEMVCSWQQAIGISRLITPGIDFGTNTSATLSFKHFYSDFNPGVTLKIQSSTDLTTWTDQPYSIIGGTGDVGPETATLTLTVPTGVNYIAFVVDGNHFNINNWYVDDVSITGSIPTCAVPTNLDVSAINSTNATATWTEAGTATSWELAYKETAASTWMTTIVNTTPTYLIPSLTAGTAYDVKVRAICGAGDTSAYSAIVNFTTSTVSCNTPTNLAAGSITTQSAAITWTAGGTETSWEVDYKLAPATTWTTATTTTPTMALTGLSTCSDYNVRVRAVCGAGIYSSYTTVVNFSTLSPVPTGLAVSNITDQSALATWTANGPATSWQVEYKLVSSVNWTSGTANTTSFPMTGLQSNANYEVRVKALCSPNESAFTTPVPFTTLGGQVTFTITATAGANGTITPSGAVTVNQGASQTFNFAPSTGYIVSVVSVDGSPITGAPTSYTFTNVSANRTIHVDFISGISENELAQLVELFPNPTSSTIELRLKSEDLHVKECKIYDMYGKLMKTFPINAETTSIDVTDFASGVYFVRMDSERGTISKKFVKK